MYCGYVCLHGLQCDLCTVVMFVYMDCNVTCVLWYVCSHGLQCDLCSVGFALHSYVRMSVWIMVIL